MNHVILRAYRLYVGTREEFQRQVLVSQCQLSYFCFKTIDSNAAQLSWIILNMNTVHTNAIIILTVLYNAECTFTRPVLRFFYSNIYINNSDQMLVSMLLTSW